MSGCVDGGWVRPAPVGNWTDGWVGDVWIMDAQSKARPPAGLALPPPRSAWLQDAGSGSSCFLLGLSWGKAGEEGGAERRVGRAVDALQGEIRARMDRRRGQAGRTAGRVLALHPIALSSIPGTIYGSPNPFRSDP